MDIRIRTREAGYCNLKLFLIFLVVYGHLIEPYIGVSGILREIYRWIYFVHMPLFAWISGRFQRSEKLCLRQMKRSFLNYAVLQAAAAVLVPYILGEAVSWKKPYWHLWYLLSLSFWSAICYCWHLLIRRFPGMNSKAVKLLLLAGSIAGGCAAGKTAMIGREYSFSRSIVFLPYVLAGMFYPGADAVTGRQRGLCRAAGFAALAAAVFLYKRWGTGISTSFLYHAQEYGKLGLWKGVYGRLFCYLMAGCLSLFLLTWVPRKRYIWTRAGVDTMGIYVCHAFVVKLLRRLSLLPEVILLAAPAAAVFLVWFFYKIFQWNRPLSAIKSSAVPGRESYGSF